MKRAQTPLVLVIADDAAERRAVATALEPIARTEACDADGAASPSRLDSAAVVAVLDGGAGEAALARLAALVGIHSTAHRPLVLVVRHATEEAIERAVVRFRPAGLVCSPAPPSALRFAVAKALPAHGGEGARRSQRTAPVLLGVSSAIRDVLDRVRRVASLPTPVLILGETGTGKELVARTIHEQGARAGARFLPINCAAMPASLLESELFGHERGAFTGADRSKLGLFEQAAGGTLFLDEVGDTPPEIQAKLLRAIESGEIRPVGSTRVRQVDVRIVSATHRDLEAAIEEGDFRRDLYYRLNTVTIELPPLRRRRVDVPFLAQHFAEEFGAQIARRVTLAEDFIEALARHDFPGNVRELRNAVERAISLASGDVVSAASLPAAIEHGRARAASPRTGTLREQLDAVETELIGEALRSANGNRTHAADLLGISRLGLRQKMRRLGIEESGTR
jgi:DNA-binding NtrC family response regulator